MSTFQDAQTDSASLAKLVNEDTDVTTRYGAQPKKSIPKVVREFEEAGAESIAEFDLALDQYKESRGFNTKGTFAAGFTYDLPNDVGLDASGNPWVLIDTSSLPVTVTAGTTPTNPPYKQVAYGTAAQVSTNTSDTAQSFIDSFALKIFQSPTDGLTEINTRTLLGGEVYEVRKVSDNSLATIYSDKEGSNPIAQNGTSNVSGSDGVVDFYIADGNYTVTINAVSAGFVLSKNRELTTVSEIALGRHSVGSKLEVTDRFNAFFTVVGGGTPDGLRVLDAGGGNTAVLEVSGNIVNAEQAGIMGGWNGTTGTDETAKLQQIINSFNNQTGELDISTLNIRADSAKIDFKLVSIKGSKAPIAGYTSGASIYVGSLGGLYTSMETNTAPELAYLKVFSADERTENGQTVVDLTGLNYPRMNNVLIYGGENGLKLKDGVSVESHYGNFYSVDISRSYNGVIVLGGNRTQSHNFYGGRIWDCVESYVNAEGTSDINFYGTAFEGDRAAQHLAAGDDPDAAETSFFGCRDECDSDPDIQVGAIKQIGTYWSGNKKPATQTISASELTEIPNQVMIQGVRDDLVPVGYNVLKNPNFEPDLANSSVIPGWEVISANLHGIEKGPFGNVVHIRGIDATQRTAVFRQSVIKVKKGWYTWGVAYERLGATGVLTTRLDDNGTLLVEGVDFEGVAVNTTASVDRIHRIKFLRDIDSLRYEVRVAAVGNEDDLYMSHPFLVQGRNSDKHQAYNKAPIQEGYASSVPTSGFYTVGDKVYNLNPIEIGASSSKYIVTGWSRLTTGTGNVLNTDWVELRSMTGN